METVVRNLWGLAQVHLARGEADQAVAMAKLAVERMSLLADGLAEEQGASLRGRFASVFDLGTRRLRYVNAGHNPPLGITPAGETLRLDATGPAMGWFETARYTCGEVEVPAGATLLFYTDGLAERANPSDDQYGASRIITSLRETNGKPAAHVLDTVVNSVDRFAGGVQAEDDTALLVVRSV